MCRRLQAGCLRCPRAGWLRAGWLRQGEQVDCVGDRGQLGRAAEVGMDENEPDIPDQAAQQVAEGGFGLRLTEPFDREVHKLKVTRWLRSALVPGSMDRSGFTWRTSTGVSFRPRVFRVLLAVRISWGRWLCRRSSS